MPKKNLPEKTLPGATKREIIDKHNAMVACLDKDGNEVTQEGLDMLLQETNWVLAELKMLCAWKGIFDRHPEDPDTVILATLKSDIQTLHDAASMLLRRCGEYRATLH